jgi:nicotinamidase-related amidase
VDAIDVNRCALVLVDYQAKLMPAIHDAEDVVRCAVLLAEAGHVLGIRVVGTEQNPKGLGPNVDDVRVRCDATVAKMHFDACEDGLVEELDWGGTIAGQVVIAGCEAHVCLMQTALGLLRKGRQVWVVESACGSRRPSDHRLAMQRLASAGATLVSPEMVLFEWLRECDHPKFKSVLQLVKGAPSAPSTASSR